MNSGAVAEALAMKTRVVAVDCPEHGSQQVEQFRVFSEWPGATCPLCDAESERQKVQDGLARRRAAETERASVSLERRRQAAGIPLRFQGKTVADFNPVNDGAEAVLRGMTRYVESWRYRLKDGCCRIFFGMVGTGKTLLACGVAEAVIGGGHTAIYTTAGEAFRWVKNSYSRTSKVSEEEALARFIDPDLLILDELGVQFGSDTEQKILFEIINGRYERMKPTFIITNLTLEELESLMGERVMDRLYENGGRPVRFDWESQRMEKKV